MLQRRITRAGVMGLCAALRPAAIAAAPTAGPNGSTGWPVVGQIGGPNQAVAVQGDWAYIGVGLRLCWTGSIRRRRRRWARTRRRAGPLTRR